MLLLIILSLAHADMCYRFSWDYGRRSLAVSPIDRDHKNETFASVTDFYHYGSPFGSSANTGYEAADTFVVLVTRDASGNDDFVYILDSPCLSSGYYCGFTYNSANGRYSKAGDDCQVDCDQDGGRLGISMNLYKCDVANNCNVTFDHNDMYPILLDDGGSGKQKYTYNNAEECYSATSSCCGSNNDCYEWDSCEGYGVFSWRWVTCCTDGLVLGHLPTENFCMRMTVYKALMSTQGKSSFKFVNMDTPGYPETTLVDRGEIGGYFEVCGRDCDMYCEAYSTCFDCISDSKCGWYDDGGVPSCVSGSESGPDSVSLADDSFSYSCCSSCNEFTTCGECTSTYGCGWCSEYQECRSGSSLGACDGNCTLFSTNSVCAFPDIETSLALVLLSPTEEDQTLVKSWSFNDGSLSGWTSHDATGASPSGVWSASGNTYVTQSAKTTVSGASGTIDSRGTFLITDETYYWSDVSLVMDMKSEERDYMGMVIRYIDEDNWYMFEWSDHTDECCDCDQRTRRIKKRQAGITTVLASDEVGFGNDWWYTVEMQVYETVYDDQTATQIDLWMSESYVFSVVDTDSGRPLRGSLGPQTSVAAPTFFDNIEVRALYQSLELGVVFQHNSSIGWKYFQFDASEISLNLVFRAGIEYAVADDYTSAVLLIKKGGVPSLSSYDTKLDSYEPSSAFGFDLLTDADQPGMYYMALLTENQVNVQVSVDEPAVTPFNITDEYSTSDEFAWEFLSTETLSAQYSEMEFRITPNTVASNSMKVFSGAGYVPYSSNFDQSDSNNTGGYYSLVIPSPIVDSTYYVSAKLLSGLANTIDFTIEVLYPDPLILTIVPTFAGTDGTSTLSINGLDFGSNVELASVTIGGVASEIISWGAISILCYIPAGQGALKSVLVQTRTGQISNSKSFSYSPPSISSISPSSGDTIGEYYIDIIGSNFGTSGSVTVGGEECDQTGGNYSHSLIQCKMPAGTGSYLPVYVVSGTKTSNGATFSYKKPYITSINPESGPTVGGTLLTISGTSMGLTGASATVGGTDCPIVAEKTDYTRVVCTVPEGEDADQTVEVVVDGLVSSNSLQFDYDAPVPSSITPVASDTVGGGTFTIEGINFGFDPSVLIGGNEATLSDFNQTHITGIIPAGVGAGKDVLVVAASLSSTATPLTFDYNAPVVDSVSPTSGLTDGYYELTIRGRNFGSSGTVSIGSDVCPSSGLIYNDSYITCTVPEGVGRSHAVTVTSSEQESVDVHEFNYNPPTITGITPGLNSRPTSGATVLTIGGTNFGPTSSSILFDSTACTELLSKHTHSSIQCYLPAGQGTSSVTVTAGEQTTDGFDFVYDGPKIDTISPSLRSTSGGGLVTIRGTNFGTSGSVLVGGSPCTTTGSTRWSDETVVCSLPIGQGKGVSVALTVADGLSDSTSVTYNYGVPRIDGISPDSGSTAVDGGLSSTITGINFGAGTELKLYFAAAQIPVSYISHTQVSFTVPDGTSIDHSIVLEVSSQNSTCNQVGAVCDFDYNSPAVTDISGCDGDAGRAATQCSIAENTELTIKGTSFGLVPGGISSVTVTVDSDQDCVVTGLQFGSTTTEHVITCLLPGTTVGGTDLDLVVSVDGLSDAANPSTISYRGPELVDGTLRLCSADVGAATGTVLDTAGAGLDNLCFNVSNLDGAPAENIIISYGADSFTEFPSGYWFDCSNVIVLNTEYGTLQCTMSVGMGADLAFKVQVYDQVSGVGLDTVSYAVPILDDTSIRTTLLGAGTDEFASDSSIGDYVYFDVTGLSLFANPELWSSVLVLYGEAGVEKDYSCNQFSFVDTNSVRCKTVKGDGSGYVFELHALNSVTEESNFTYSYPQIPIVTSVSGCPTTDGSGTADCPTSGGTEITVTGENFCAFEGDLCTISVELGDSLCSSPAEVSPGTVFTCTTPAQTGVDLPLIITQSVSGEYVYSSTAVYLVSYKRAVITKVSGCTDDGTETVDCSRSDSSHITITGTSFGGSGATVLVGGVECDNVTHSIAQTQVQCDALPGTQRERAVILFQKSGTISAAPFGTLSYSLCPVGTFSESVDTTGCTDCIAGRYTNVKGSTSCVDCDTGRFALNPGSSTCGACLAGLASGSGASECTECTVGKYASATSSSRCLSCDVGEYTSANRSTGCTQCPTGRFASSLGSSVCDECSTGEYAPTRGTVDCLVCDAGSYQSNEGYTECDQCEPGRYESFSGQSECDDCDIGTSSSSSGSVSCDTCSGGYYSNDTALESCLICDAGTYSSLDTESGKSECVPCPAGEYINVDGQATCLFCPKGRFSGATGSTLCSACSAGKVTTSLGRTECTSCLTGKFALGTGNPECSSCSAGRYTDTKTASSCKYCAAGRFQAATGKSSCDQCLVGTANSASGQSECEPCDVGAVATSLGSESCTLCSPGSFAAFNDPGCTECSAGSFSAFEGSGSCTTCPAGTFSDNDGSTVCTACGTGKATATDGLTLCDDCEPGRFAATEGNFFCPPCGPGTYSGIAGGASTCTECLAGTYQGASIQTGCLQCPNGRFSASTRSASCDICDVGKYASGSVGKTKCSTCQAGEYQNLQEQSSCKTCPIGKYSNTLGASSCTECPSGSFSNTTASTSCTTCEAGFISSTGDSSCTPCSAGEIAFATGRSSCSTCSTGKFSEDDGASVCELCGAGYYTGITSSVECLECAAGKSNALSGSPSCTACDIGKYSNETAQSTCQECPTGTYQKDIEQTICIDCEPGEYSEFSGSITCELCAPGFFSTGYGTAECSPCPKGQYQDSYGNTTCIACPAGSITSQEGQRMCTDCAKGRFANDSGLSECTVCSEGSYAGDSGYSICDLCEPGRFQDSTGQSSCDRCDRGTFEAGNGSTLCQPCGKGTYANDLEFTSCLNCSAGTYADTLGTEDCKVCLVGTFMAGEGATQCDDCPSGQFQRNLGSIDCSDCSPGYFTPGGGYEDCEECLPGTFASLNGSDDCTDCSAGKFQEGNHAIACIDCLAGKFASGLQNEECAFCAPGTFSNAAGSPVCSDCPAGFFQELSGQNYCQNCSLGYYSSNGLSSCILCPERTISSELGSASCSACPENANSNSIRTTCLCEAGYFGYTEADLGLSNSLVISRCDVCPRGAICDEAGVTFSNMMTESGFWRQTTDSLQFYSCQLVSHCTGGRTSECGDHRTGSLCALCEEGYQEFGVNCEECYTEGTSIVLSIGVFILFLVLIFGMYTAVLRMDSNLMNKMTRMQESANAPRAAGDDMFIYADDVIQRATIDGVPSKPPNFVFKMKIILGFFQIAVGIAFAADIPWPDSFKQFIAVFNVANFDFVQWTRFGCVVPIDFYDKHLAVAVFPLFGLFVLFMLYLAPKIWDYYQNSHDQSNERKMIYHKGKRKFMKMFVFTLFLIFPSVSSVVLKLYKCEQVEGHWFLWEDFTVTCYTDEYYARAIMNIVFVLLYPIGIPALLCTLLYRKRKRLLKPSVRIELGFLYHAFEISQWWFEIVDMSHKLLLTSVLMFFPSSAQLPVALTILIAHLMVILINAPYTRKGDDRLHQLVQIVLFLMILAAYTLEAEESYGDATDVLLTVLFVFMTISIFFFFIGQVLRVIIKYENPLFEFSHSIGISRSDAETILLVQKSLPWWTSFVNTTIM